MTTTAIKTVGPANTAYPAFLSLIESDFNRIRERAFNLFRENGGSDWDNWLTAERDLFEVPNGELNTTDSGYEARIAMPGFTPEQLTVTATAEGLTVLGEAGAEGSQKQIFRHFGLETPINPDGVTAELADGELLVKLPKAEAKAKAAAG